MPIEITLAFINALQFAFVQQKHAAKGAETGLLQWVESHSSSRDQ